MLLGGAAELAGELLAGQRDPDEDVAGPRAARLHRMFNMIRMRTLLGAYILSVYLGITGQFYIRCA